LATAYEAGGAGVRAHQGDACEDIETLVESVQEIAFGVPALSVSVRTGEGLEALSALLAPGRTAVLLAVGGRQVHPGQCAGGRGADGHPEIREDDAHGRHTTTHGSWSCCLRASDPRYAGHARTG